MARKKSVSPKQLVDQATGIRLSAHERLCAERMQTIQNSINELKEKLNLYEQMFLLEKEWLKF